MLACQQQLHAPAIIKQNYPVSHTAVHNMVPMSEINIRMHQSAQIASILQPDHAVTVLDAVAANILVELTGFHPLPDRQISA